MTSASRHFKPNVVLAQAGLLALDAPGRVDLARTRAVYFPGNSGYVVINRQGRPGGIVPPAEEEDVRRRVTAALTAFKDPATGRPLGVTVTDVRVPHEGPKLGGPLRRRPFRGSGRRRYRAVGARHRRCPRGAASGGHAFPEAGRAPDARLVRHRGPRRRGRRRPRASSSRSTSRPPWPRCWGWTPSPTRWASHWPRRWRSSSRSPRSDVANTRAVRRSRGVAVHYEVRPCAPRAERPGGPPDLAKPRAGAHPLRGHRPAPIQRRELPDPLREPPAPDVGVRAGRPAVPGGQRGGDPAVRVLPRGVPGHEDHRHPPRGGRPAADRAARRLARTGGATPRPASRATAARTARSSTWRCAPTTLPFEGRRAMLVVAQDITEQKRSAEALRQSEERYRTPGRAVPGRASPSTARAWSCSRTRPACSSSAPRRRWRSSAGPTLDFVHPDSRPSVIARACAAWPAGSPSPSWRRSSSASTARVIDVEAGAVPFTFHDAPAVQVVIRDISDRKRAETLQARALPHRRAHARSVEDMPAFYRTIHGVVGELMYARELLPGPPRRGDAGS